MRKYVKNPAGVEDLWKGQKLSTCDLRPQALTLKQGV